MTEELKPREVKAQHVTILVTPSMRLALEKIAKNKGVKLSEVARYAFAKIIREFK